MKKIATIFLSLFILGGLFFCRKQAVLVPQPSEEIIAEKAANEMDEIERTKGKALEEIDEIRLKDSTLKLSLVLGAGKHEYNKLWPSMLDVDKEGNIYVLERKNHRILVFSSSGERIKTIGQEGKKHGEFSLVSDLTFDDENNLFVAEYENQRIQIFSKQREFLNSFKVPFYPGRIVTDNQFLYITVRHVTQVDYLVYKYTKDGKLISGFGDVKKRPRSALYDFEKRRQAAIDNLSYNFVYLSSDLKGNVYVVHRFLPKIKKYSGEGNILMESEYQTSIKNKKPPIVTEIISVVRSGQRGQKKATARHFPVCYDIATDTSGTIYLLVATDHNQDQKCALYRLDPEGNLLEKIHLPILCGRMHIDSFNNFYFLSPGVDRLVYKYIHFKSEASGKAELMHSCIINH